MTCGDRAGHRRAADRRCPGRSAESATWQRDPGRRVAVAEGTADRTTCRLRA